MPSVYPMTLLPPSFRGDYPHMAKRDSEVWTKFLDAHGAAFAGFVYDVAFGGMLVEAPGASTPERLGYQYSTALKVDALGFQRTTVWVIEVRPEAHVSALGAALTYAMVAEREKLSALPLLPAIVCEYIQPDVEWACRELNITVVKV